MYLQGTSILNLNLDSLHNNIMPYPRQTSHPTSHLLQPSQRQIADAPPFQALKISISAFSATSNSAQSREPHPAGCIPCPRKSVTEYTACRERRWPKDQIAEYRRYNVLSYTRKTCS